MITRGQQRSAIEFPPGVDPRPLLLPTRHNAWELAGSGGTEYRRAITRTSPLLFAITYLSRFLRQPDTELISFSPMHLDLCREARHWVPPTGRRAGWVGPRESAKSTWLFLLLPAWAIAHGHRRYLTAFSATDELARGQLDNLHTVLRCEHEEDRLLLGDFPELAPRRGGGARTTLASGAAIEARGMGAASLGRRSGADRPDLIVGDDIEKGAADYSAEAKTKNLTRLTQNILPMNARRGVVQLAGTTTMHGSITHDLVRAALADTDREHRVAPWIAEHEFTPHYYPAILDEGTAAERSLWPQQWSLEWLRALREQAPQDYAMNYANRPEEAGAHGYWTRELIRYDSRVEPVRRVLYVDPAMTNKARSDQTAIVVVGVDRWGKRAVVEHAEAGRISGLELGERVWALCRAQPGTLKEVIVESNQGGDRVVELIAPHPPGVKVDTEHVVGSKRSRLEVALSHYQRAAVVHRCPLPALEEQALAWTPAADRDDLLDALAGALRRIFPA